MNKKILIAAALISATTQASAAGGEEGIPFVVVYQTINFIIFSAILYWIAKKKMGAFFSERVGKHEKAKEEAVKAFTDAQQKHDEVNNKLKMLIEQEGSALQRAQEEAKLLKSRLIHEAEDLAKSVLEDAKKTAQYEYEKAKLELRREFFEQALSQSKKEMSSSIDKGNQKTLHKEFVEGVGAQV